jgi:putative ABC transport system permease protein
MLGEELAALGGPEALEDTGIKLQDGRNRVSAPIMVLDDESFAAYCRDAGIGAPSVEAPFVVVINTIWDNLHSDRMNRRLIPYLRQTDGSALTLYPAENGAQDLDGASVRIAAYASAEPDIRQESENFSLPQVMPESAYARIADRQTPIEYPTFTDGYHMMRILEKVIESAKTRAWVDVAPAPQLNTTSA